MRNELVFLYSNLLKIQPYYKNRKRAREFGLTAVRYADQAEASTKHEEALLYKEIALEFLDLAIGLHPATGFAQSTYELVYGSRLLKANMPHLSHTFISKKFAPKQATFYQIITCY